MHKRFRYILGAFLILAVVVGAYFFVYRRAAIDRLERIARQPATPKALELDDLGTYSGEYATTAILAVARDQNASPENQTAAIRMLRWRRESWVGEELSKFFTSEFGLIARESAAATLEQLECNKVCASNILRYLDRRSFGMRLPEENLGGGPLLSQRNKQLEEQLLNILKKNEVQTARVLREEYGIRPESLAPHSFAIRIVVQLGFSSMCPDLKSSRSSLMELRADPELIRNLDEAARQLKCEM